MHEMILSKEVQMCGEGAENLQRDDGYDIIDGSCEDRKGGMNASRMEQPGLDVRAEAQIRSAGVPRHCADSCNPGSQGRKRKQLSQKTFKRFLPDGLKVILTTRSTSSRNY